MANLFSNLCLHTITFKKKNWVLSLLAYLMKDIPETRRANYIHKTSQNIQRARVAQ